MPSANRPRSQARKGVQLNRFTPLLLLLIGCTSQPAPAPFVPGVPTDHLNVAAVVQAQYPATFQDAAGLTEEQSAANATRNVRMWGPGVNYWVGPQLIGDCTAHGGAHVVQALRWKQSGGRASGLVSTLYLYPLARRDGGFRLRIPCRSDGGYPSYLAHNWEQHGYLLEGEAGLPAYSAAAATAAGCNSPSREQLTAGKKRAGGKAQPITDVKAWRNAICAGYPCTVAIPWKPGKTYVVDGKRCIRFDGRNLGGHQISSIGYDGSSGKPFWFLLNSHGTSWPTNAPPLGDEPRGGVWVDEKWAQWIVDNGEIWAFSELPEFSAEPLDLTIFDAVSRVDEPADGRRVSIAKTTLAP